MSSARAEKRLPSARRRRVWRLAGRAVALVLAVVAISSCRPGPSGSDRAAPGSQLPAVIDVDPLGVHDRCTSCHMDLLAPDHTLAAEPRTSHPGRMLEVHPPARFGCTPCHGGNGRAVSAREAHDAGTDGLGFRSGASTEIACGRCHPNEIRLEGAPHLSHGRELMRHADCDGCHQVGEAPRIGRPGPDLAGVASRTNPRWLFRWIKNPRDYASNARMPRYELDDRSIDALVGYLMTFRQTPPFDTTGFPRGDANRGAGLVRLSFCISCHSINDKGGTQAIDLGRVGNKLTRARLLAVVGDTHTVDPITPMPQYHFVPGEVADVAAYLREQLSDPSFDSDDADSALTRLGTFWPNDLQRVETGRRLFKELRCGNCHAFPGGESWIRVAPNLSRLAERKPAEIAWGKTRYPRTPADYVWHKVERPRVYETAPHQLKMPGYDFTPEEARDVTLAVLAQSDTRVLPDTFVVHGHAADTLALTGEFARLVARYRCLSCHSVGGVGHNISYDLGLEGSRARGDWLAAYLKLPYSIRPILTVRMPIFHLDDREAQVLAAGISSMWRDAGVDSEGAFAVEPRMVEAGRVLFDRNGCMGCHQVGSKGGYVGPGFTTGTPVGRKLRPGWMVRWLQDSRAIKPDAVEPHYRFARDEARALTAYLMSLAGSSQGAGK
jgi:mono/diheme cytochrome c family protein